MQLEKMVNQFHRLLIYEHTQVYNQCPVITQTCLILLLKYKYLFAFSNTYLHLVDTDNLISRANMV